MNIEVEDDEELSAVGKGDPKNVWPMDQFVAPVDPSVPLKKFQRNINDSIDKEKATKWGNIWLDGCTRKMYPSMLSTMMTSKNFVRLLVVMVQIGGNLCNI